MLQIQFLDRNIVSALVPAFSMKPEQIIFLYDKRIIGLQGQKAVERAIKKRLPETTIQFLYADMLRLDAIEETLEKVIMTNQQEEIQIDITGGTELMTACGLMMCEKYHLTPTYVDFYHNRVFHVFTRKKLADITNLTLDDYLKGAGGKYLSQSRHTPKETDFERILLCAEYVFSHLDDWKVFHKYMTMGYSTAGVMEFSMNENVEYTPCMQMLSMFEKYGFCRQIGEDRYLFSSEADKEYLTVYGIWLEMYIYIKAKSCYDEVLLGALIDWDDSDHIDLKDNEIDVVVMKHSQPIFISCKMMDIRKEAVYEVNALAKRLGGEYARSIVATTDCVSVEKHLENGMYQRLEKMRVGLIEVHDFQKLSAVDVFQKAI